MRPVAEHHASFEFNAASSQAIDLRENALRVEHHAGSHHIHNPLVENTAGNLMQFIDLISHHHGVARIGSTLVTHNEIELRGE